MPPLSPLPRDVSYVHDMPSDGPLWWVLGAEGAIALHWPDGPPAIYSETLAKCRERAEAFAHHATILGILLANAEVEGATAPFEETDIPLPDDDPPEPWEEDTDDWEWPGE